MKHLSLFNGDQIPILGLGTWKSGKGKVYKAVRKSIEMGYRHFDCAYIYLNEKEIGSALNDAILVGDVNREELWITSKLWNTHHRKEDVKEALSSTLHDFNLDYLDLYLMHWPVAQKKEVVFSEVGRDLISLDDLPITETWAGLEACVRSDFTRHIGVANFSIKKLEVLRKSAVIKPEVNQIELHPLLQQKKLVAYCKNEHIIVTAYSPLGSPDRIQAMKAPDEPDMFQLSEVKTLADRHNCSPAQVLIAWHINNHVTVIPKSTNPERMKQNLESVDIMFSEDDMAIIASLDRQFRYITGKFWALEGSDYSLQNLWDE